MLSLGLVVHKLRVEDLGKGVLGDVILRGAQAACDDCDVTLGDSASHSLGDSLARISDR